jgi:hypothetical protein
MKNWLKKHNFTYKKPVVAPGKGDPEAQENWIKEYEELKSKRPSDEAICFMDGVHPTHLWRSSGLTNPMPLCRCSVLYQVTNKTDHSLASVIVVKGLGCRSDGTLLS